MCNTNFIFPLLKLVSKLLCHVFVVTIVTFGFWMQHFQTGGLRQMVRHPGHHDRRISPPTLDFFLWGYVKDKVFSTPVPDITNIYGGMLLHIVFIMYGGRPVSSMA